MHGMVPVCVLIAGTTPTSFYPRFPVLLLSAGIHHNIIPSGATTRISTTSPPFSSSLLGAESARVARNLINLCQQRVSGGWCCNLFPSVVLPCAANWGILFYFPVSWRLRDPGPTKTTEKADRGGSARGREAYGTS